VAEDFAVELAVQGWRDLRRIPSTNPVLAGTYDGAPAVAKATLLSNGDELAALRAWAALGVPTPPVVASGTLERGIAWYATRFVEGTHPVLTPDIVAEVLALLRVMHTVPAHGFPTALELPNPPVQTWAVEVLSPYADTVPLRAALEDLLTAPPSVVVHGDLTDRNLILDGSQRSVWVIDPYGVAGLPEQDLARLVGSALEEDPAYDWFSLVAQVYGPFDESLVRRWMVATDVLVTALAVPDKTLSPEGVPDLVRALTSRFQDHRPS
jgi:aminoglycoside phosphotransferase (APT) family kinase protein